jgi:hypothetical protein
MRKHSLVQGWFLALVVVGATAHEAAAQEEPAADSPPADAPAADAPAADAPPAGAAKGGEVKDGGKVDEAAVKDALEGVTEDPSKTYLFIGARYRNVMIPEFVQHLFADGGSGLYAHTPGLEFGIRKAGFEYQLFTMLGLYNLSDVPFKGSSDASDAWEIIDANYKILYLGADFMWSTDDFTPGLSLTYGAGVGLGLVLGDLNRVQAFPTGAESDPSSYVRCESQNDPRDPGARFCNENNEHYGDYVEPSWANGGSSPLIFPWLAGQIGLRYKAHRNFVAHVELGVMPTGAFVGLGADYGL